MNMSKMQKFLRKTKIRNRLVLSFLIISLFPLIIVAFFSYINSYNDIEERNIEYSDKICTQLTNSVNDKFDSYVEKFKIIVHNGSINYDVSHYREVKDQYRRIDIDNRIMSSLASIIGTGEGIDSVEVSTIHGDKFIYGSPITTGNLDESRLLQKCYNNNGIVWDVGYKEVSYEGYRFIFIGRSMSTHFDSKVIGFTLMGIEMNQLINICKENSDKNTTSIIIDEEGKIIIHPNDQTKLMEKINPKILDKINQLEEIKRSGESINTTFKINTDEGIMLVSYGVINKNKWKVLHIVPYSYLMTSTINNGVFSFIIAIICILFSLLFSITVTKSISEPVDKIMNTMDQVGKGNLDVQIKESWDVVKDEHAVLSKGFNKMILDLRKSIDEVYKAKIKEKELLYLKKEAELNSLQQQINPHFLYNTLEAIYWSAQLKGEEKIGEMIEALGSFFRSSISKGRQFVTVSEELKNAKNYVYLLKIRYKQKYAFNWDIEDNLLNFKTIKLILQPIIENAVFHGLEDIEQGGTVDIRGYKKGNDLYFEITDNGVGIDEHKLNNLIQHINSETNPDDHVGIKNVNQRIKLFYGEEYGIQIKSKLNEGTKVIIKLAAIKDEIQLTTNKDIL